MQAVSSAVKHAPGAKRGKHAPGAKRGKTGNFAKREKTCNRCLGLVETITACAGCSNIGYLTSIGKIIPLYSFIP